jgi:Flp pilus assembly protein TadD
LLVQGSLELYRRRPSQAETAFRRAAALSPSASTFARIGIAYNQSGRLLSSLPYLERATSLEPHQPWVVRVALAAALDASGRHEQAERLMTQVIASLPDDPMLLNNCAYGMADAGILLDGATRILEKAARLAPDNPMVLDSLGWAYYKQDRFVDALSFLERAAQRSDDPIIHRHLLEARRKAQREQYL